MSDDPTRDARELEALSSEWLGPGDVPSKGHVERWFAKDDAFDAMLRERFGALLDRAVQGELDAVATSPRCTLALVILLDQISRNVHRGTARAFAGDGRAIAIARAAIARGVDQEVPELHRSFFYMPLMHAEDLAAQEECVRLFERLAEEASGDAWPLASSGLDFARRHRDIIARFGRFPHRNAILGRESSDEERAFLEQPGSSF